MEDEDYRFFELNGTKMKVFRAGRIHTFHKTWKKWTNRKFQLLCGYYRTGFGYPIKYHLIHNVIAMCYLGEKPEGYETDHINNNPLDNRLENLQYITPQENCRKRIYYKRGRPIKGYTKRGNKYEACIKHLGKSIHLGLFEKEEEARQSYIDAKLKYHNVVI